MSEMLYDVISLIKERAEEKSLELRFEIIEEVPEELISDEFRIRQILVNLMNNAVKYTETGTITLKIGGNYTDAGYELKLIVKDTGKGIREEEQEHLFEAFSRADVKANASIEGTGLGLAIVLIVMTIVNRVLKRAPHKDHLLDDMIKWPDNMDKSVWYYADVQEATNSHTYTMSGMTDGVYEIWQKLRPVRDWEAFEKMWSTAHSAANPGEVVNP